jgi:hypothetical protein
MRFISFAALSIALAAPAVAADKQPPSRMPSEMTPTEIKAYNADISADHPYYIKCRKTEVIGSLARKLRVCRTNEQWKEASAKGNDNTRETLEGFARSGGTNGN